MTGEYQEYLNSPIWWEKRDRILERDGWRCRKCESGINLRVHHIRYPEVLGEEPDSDLITLCDRCHTEIHAHDIQKKKENEERKEYYRRQHQLLNEWIREAIQRDFIFGGMDNMCRHALYKESIEKFNKKHGCDLKTGGATMQHILGQAHWLAVNELHAIGFTVEDIKLIMPLEKQTIDKYLQTDRSGFLYDEPYSDVIIAAVKEYIRDEMSRRQNEEHSNGPEQSPVR